jgi:type VI protein secretion system component Hcp
MAAWMNWGGTTPPTIEGDATDKDHLNWIQLYSFRQGRFTGTGQRDFPGIITVTKRQDSASTDLFRAAGGHSSRTQTVFIDLQSPGEKYSVIYIKLMAVVIENVRLLDNGMESVTLTFNEIAWGTATGLTPNTTPPPQQTWTR